MTDDAETFGIDPSKIYRRYSPETEKILGLKRTAIDEAIKHHDLPEPLLLTEHGTARGWLGTTLIEVQRKRLAMAEERRAVAATNATAKRQRRQKQRRSQ